MKLRKISIFIGLLIIAALIYVSNYKEVVSNIRSVPLLYLFSACLLLIPDVLSRVFRWKILIPRNSDYLELTKAQFLGKFLNKILPTKMGALFKTYYLKKAMKLPYGISFGTVLMENIIEMSFILVTCFIVVLLLPARSMEMEKVIFITLSAFLILFIIFIVVLRFASFKWFFKRLSDLSFMKKRMKNKKLNFRSDLKGYLRSLSIRQISVGYLFTLSSWLFVTASSLVLVKGLSLDIPILYIYLVATLPWAIGAFGILPGGLGIQEVTVVGILSIAGLSLPMATTLALLFRMVDYIVYAVFGLWSYLTLSWKPKHFL